MSYRSNVLAFLTLVSLLTVVIAGQARATVLTFDVRYQGSIHASHTDTAYGGYRATSEPTTFNVGGYGDAVFDANPLATTHTDTVTLTRNDNNATQAYDFRYEKGNDWTPSIAVDYSVEFSASEGSPSSGNVANNDFASNGASLQYQTTTGISFWYTLTPNPGTPVRINSFDLLTYLGTEMDVEWKLWAGTVNGGRTGVENPGTLLASQFLDDYGATITNPARVQMPGVSIYYGPITLEVTRFSGDGNSLALDNLNFDVPEPAGLTFVAVGALMLLRRRK